MDEDLYEDDDELFIDTPPECPELHEDEGNRAKLLTPRSKELYDGAYKKFEKYMLENGIEKITEQVLLAYMADLSKKFKTSALFPNYSMLKATLGSTHNVDISKFLKLRAFVKQQSIGCKTKKTKTFTKYEFRKFLCAPDDKYLMHKVAFIFGVAGSCSREELTYLTVDNIEDLSKAILVKIPNRRRNKNRTFMIGGQYLDFYRKYVDMRPSGIVDKRFFLSYRDGKCTRQVVGEHRIGAIAQEIAAYLKLPNAKDYTGRSFRSVSPTFLEDAGADIYTPPCEMNSGFPANMPEHDASELVEIKAEIDESSSDFSVAAAEIDAPETSTNWMASLENDSKIANISSAIGSTIDLKDFNRPIIVRNCNNCTFNIR